MTACWTLTDQPATPNGAALTSSLHVSEQKARQLLDSRFLRWVEEDRKPFRFEDGAYYQDPQTGLAASVRVQLCWLHRSSE